MSSIQNDYFYGWETLYKTIEGSVNKKDDLLIALVHFLLTRHSKFRCLGIGDDRTLHEDEQDSGSELLPDSWNDGENDYALRYTYQKQLYILVALRAEGSLIITLMDVKARKVSNIGLDPEELVKNTKGNLTEIIPTVNHLVDRYRKELFDPVFSGTKQTATTQTAEPSSSLSSQGMDPQHFGDPIRVPFGLYQPPEPRPFGFPQVGTGDLDPLGRGGPGNLFPMPSHPDFRSGFGPLARPRFDPFGPPVRGVRPYPSPDHFPPPGGDDYYM